uniref:Uncharacterized protein n=1 Tax=Globisporangium ultimum (strain ATCC 200006 / CBS 805.95 / DAOM BR144) TaxID=431595 RepID=K3W8Z5_GLOUD
HRAIRVFESIIKTTALADDSAEIQTTSNARCQSCTVCLCPRNNVTHAIFPLSLDVHPVLRQQRLRAYACKCSTV